MNPKPVHEHTVNDRLLEARRGGVDRVEVQRIVIAADLRESSNIFLYNELGLLGLLDNRKEQDE